jgi:amino acid adenylation domain-containing protein
MEERTGDPAQHRLSFSQEAMWLSERIAPSDGAYNIVRAWWLSGDLNLSALQTSVSRVSARHQILRSRVTLKEGNPFLMVEDAAPPLQSLDLSHLGKLEARAEAIRRAEREGCRPFDVTGGPMARFFLMSISPEAHLFLIILHHLISDGQSCRILASELSQYYNNQVAAIPLALHKVAAFANVAEQHRHAVESSQLDGQKARWLAEVSGIPELSFETDRIHPPDDPASGAEHTFAMSGQTVSQLAAAARIQNVSPFTLCCAAFGLTLFHQTGQRNFIVGTPFADRARRQDQSLIGPLARMLPLRMNFNGNPTLSEILSCRVRPAIITAFKYAEYPYERLIHELRVQGHVETSLFQAEINYIGRSSDANTLALWGLGAEQAVIRLRRSTFPIRLILRESKDALFGWLQYRSQYFSERRIELVIEQFRRSVDQFINDGERRLSDVEPLSEPERSKVQSRWTGHRRLHDAGTILDLYERQVGAKPNEIALFCENERISFFDLNVRANKLAHYLADLGIGPEAIVAIALPHSIEMVVSILAVLKAGGAYLPLDLTSPDRRLAYMLADARPALLICQNRFLRRLAVPIPTLPIDDAGRAGAIDRLAGNEAPDRGRTLSPGNTAYVIYTSGSTGDPKGVWGLHGGLLNRVLWFGSLPQYRTVNLTLATSSPAFIDGSTELLTPLVHGKPVVLRGRRSTKEVSELAKLCEVEKVECVTLVPSLLSALLAVEHPEALNACKLCVSTGEALPYPLAKKFKDRFPDACLLNLYGMSEATGDSLYGEFDGSEIVLDQPVWNTQAYILTENLLLAPDGVIGELFLSGDALARGYVGRSALTAGSFIPNPYGPPGSRMYRTGDRAKRRIDGTIQLCGRADDQVKIRGNRIELGEIENALLQMVGVSEAAVILQRSATQDEVIAAYYVGVPTPEAVRIFLHQGLPDDVVPARLVRLEKIPLKPNRKVDREALRRVDVDRQTSRASLQMQELLSGIWKSVLGVEPIGVNDSFFDVGGHSLLAVEVAALIKQEIGHTVTVTEIFQFPTIASLADHLSNRKYQSDDVGTGRSRSESRMQRRMLFTRR